MYWAFQHYEELASLRQANKLPPRPQSASFLVETSKKIVGAVRLAAEGCSNKEIASRQFWSEVTVKRKMQDIYRKLQVTDRAQAVADAMRMGLI